MSSGVTAVRHETASQPVRPAIPHARASPSLTASGSSTSCVSSSTATCSAIAPRPYYQYLRPSLATATASEPITYGGSGEPP